MASKPGAPLPTTLTAAVRAVEDRKAQDIVTLDIRGLSNATDFFLVGSGTSDAHVRGIADLVIERVAEAGHRPHHVEGLAAGRWVLLDFVDVVVHLFHPETRHFYQLERLWSDAPQVMLPVESERKV